MNLISTAMAAPTAPFRYRRRSLLKAGVGLPFASSAASVAGKDADPTRVALVIGNNAYRHAPLFNAVNDAEDMQSLLAQAGFTVRVRMDATRDQIVQGIEEFGAAIRKSEVKLAVFYYAGHGAQLDWRNFLIPIDADVKTSSDLRSQCVDLGLLLKQLTHATSKTHVVVLDACRDNPFGDSVRLEQKGLSQFDTPPGTLLAYATSPGNVAADGTGRNGLYTENLVRELSGQTLRLEDALKRVRLNVRLASQGRQIPWESTSLESDVFIFPVRQSKLSESDMEKLVAQELEAWNRIKDSKDHVIWADYIRKYPNGRFTELAQARLNRLLAAVEASHPQTPIATKPAAPGTLGPALAGLHLASSMQALPLQASQNPFSAGTFRMRRPYSVGDEVSLRLGDPISGVAQQVITKRILRVDTDQDRVAYSDTTETDLNGNPYFNPLNQSSRIDVPVQFFPDEIQIGKKWTCAWRGVNPLGMITSYGAELMVVAKESVVVPAGKFDSFKIDGRGSSSAGAQIRYTLWVVPGLIEAIKMEIRSTYGPSNRRLELVELKQRISPV